MELGLFSDAEVTHYLKAKEEMQWLDKHMTKLSTYYYGDNVDGIEYDGGYIREHAIREFHRNQMDKLFDHLARVSVQHRESIYSMTTTKEQWNAVKGKFSQIQTLNFAAQTTNESKADDFFQLAFAFANIPIAVINLLLHFVVKRSINKYNL